jgi:hypothetical protein
MLPEDGASICADLKQGETVDLSGHGVISVGVIGMIAACIDAGEATEEQIIGLEPWAEDMLKRCLGASLVSKADLDAILKKEQ